MKKEKVGFITPAGQLKYMEYYNILEFAKKVCYDYINKSEENLKKFFIFKKGYTKFEPYLDFILSELHYVMVNPLNFKDVIIYNDDGLKINKISKLKNGKFSLYRENFIWNYSCSDASLFIEQFDNKKHSDGIITKDGYYVKVDRDKDLYHEQVAEQILNQYLIGNKELYLDYIKYVKNFFSFKRHIDNNDYYTNFAIKYLSSRLGHIWYTDVVYVYNSSLLTDDNNRIISELKSRYTNSGVDISEEEDLNEIAIKQYQKIIKRL